MKSGPVRKTVTVLFCDLTGSTMLGERLDPEVFREVIQRYFDEMRSVIELHGGTVEKFIGDAVMAVFGVPRVREDDALRAVRAAADMQAALAEANIGFERDFGTRIAARIGVNTGEVIAGDPASTESFVSGDTVNTAARLEQAADPGEILMGETTYRLVRAAVIAEPLSPLALKGKSEPTPAYRLVVVEAGGEMLPRRLDAPLAGRERELEALRGAFDEVASGSQSRLVTLIGEAGLGKSRLAHELLGMVEGRARVLRGRCLPYGDGITFWPVTEILEAAAEISSTVSHEEACEKVERLLPPEQQDLGRRLSALLSGGPAGSIQDTFLAVRRWLEHLASEGPVVVVFDDIQWGEESFLDLVQYLATFVTGRPLLLLCLARPELLESRADRAQTGEFIRLAPLGSGPSEAMVANLLGGGSMPGEVAEKIVAAAAGNPLFIEEMLRMLVDQGAIARRDGRWVVETTVSDLGMPETVQAVIAARLDGLEPGERTVLQHAAVVGEVFWWSAVAHLTDDATAVETGRGLQALARKDLIRPDRSTTFGEDAFRFGHLLIRDVAYESLPKRARANLHERFARWVDERAGARTAEYDEIIGYHAERAHRYLTELAPASERAASLARIVVARLGAAGERAFARDDLSAAINLLSRAVALVPSEDPGRPALLTSLGDAVAEGGRLEDAVRIFDEAIAGARARGDRRAELRVSMRRLHVDMHFSKELSHEYALAEAERARVEFEEMGDGGGLAQALRIEGAVYLWAGRLERSIAVFERVAELAQGAGDRGLELDALHWMCLALEQGPTPIGVSITRIEALAETHEADLVLWSRHVGVLEGMRGNFAKARALIARGIAAARELGIASVLASGFLRNSAYIEFLAGDLAAAEEQLREAVAILTRIGDTGHLASVAPDLALLLLASEAREAEALEIVERTEAMMIEDDVDAVVRARAARAMILARQGEAADAERIAREGVARAWATEYSLLRAISMEALAEVLHRAGRTEDAVGALSKAIATYDAKGNVAARDISSAALMSWK